MAPLSANSSNVSSLSNASVPEAPASSANVANNLVPEVLADVQSARIDVRAQAEIDPINLHLESRTPVACIVDCTTALLEIALGWTLVGFSNVSDSTHRILLPTAGMLLAAHGFYNFGRGLSR